MERKRHYVLLCHHHLCRMGLAPNYSCHNIPGLFSMYSRRWKRKSYHTLHQATITLGYFFSPFVMSRLNTRPLFIATLLISAVAQVYFVFAFCICIDISIGICICDIPTEHLSSIHHCTPHQRCSSGNCTG